MRLKHSVIRPGARIQFCPHFGEFMPWVRSESTLQSSLLHLDLRTAENYSQLILSIRDEALVWTSWKISGCKSLVITYQGIGAVVELEY
jgi:hypothetical protein